MRTGIMFVWLVFSGAITGCEPTVPPPKDVIVAADASVDSAPTKHDAGMPTDAPKINFAEGTTPGPEVVLVKGEGLEVTLADYDHALKISRLMQPGSPQSLKPIPAERLALPVAQFTTARGILNRKTVSHEASLRKIVVSESDAVAWLKADRHFKILGEIWGKPALDDALKTVGLTQEDLLALAKEEVARGRLADLLAAEITEDEVWARYAFEMTTAKVAVAMGMNVPTASELNDFIVANEKEIESYFQENAKTFRVPKRVRADTLSPLRDQSPNEALLRQASEMLKAGTKAPEIAAKLGLELREGIRMVKQENPRAFRSETGDTGFVMDGPRGPHAWVVRGFYASHVPELNRGMRRQVAAEMMRRESLTVANTKRLKSARKIMRKLGDGSNAKRLAKAKSKIEALKLQFEVVGPFTKSPNGSMPVFGLSPEVVQASFELSTKRRQPKNPIYSRERGFSIHLLERSEPSRKVFDESREAFVERYRAEARPSIVERYIQAKLAEMKPSFDLNPLSIKYGTLEKKP